MLISEKFSDNETPTGTIDGSNKVFTLLYSPDPIGSLDIFLSGSHLTITEDYTLSGSTITFANAPVTGDILRVFYRY